MTSKVQPYSHELISEPHLVYGCRSDNRSNHIVDHATQAVMNDKEKEALHKFRVEVANVLQPNHDDTFLLRWLRARNLEVANAEKMLRDSLEWRKIHNIDSLADKYKPPEVLKHYYAEGKPGHDKEGCLVWLVLLGSWDINGILHSVKKDDFINHTVSILEKTAKDLKEQSIKLGRPIWQQYCIVDLENFGLRSFTSTAALDLIRSLVDVHERNYPEMLKKVVAINTPTVFWILFKIIKPILNENTVKKIHIYGKERWKEVLLKDIDASELPEHWGGTKRDGTGNPKCPSIICLGGDVPERYYRSRASKLANVQGSQTAHIDKGAMLWLDMEIIDHGSVLHWEFQTEDYDIGFGVFRKTPNGNEEVKAIQRVNSHLVPEEGQIKCKRGTYAICFDNAYSMTRGKKLLYRLYVTKKEEN